MSIFFNRHFCSSSPLVVLYERDSYQGIKIQKWKKNYEILSWLGMTFSNNLTLTLEYDVTY